LLEEISWEGNARRYREGGRGFENVLTAEVFQALDFLPRGEFFGRLVASVVGAPDAVKKLSVEAEQLAFSLLPGDISLAESPAAASQLCVQPDGVIESPSVYCLLEAKRIKRGAFQPEQLAREYLAVVQEAGQRSPLLLLVLPGPPPVAVTGHGRLDLHNAIAKCLKPVLARCEHEFPAAEELLRNVGSVVAYTTWPVVEQSIKAGLQASSFTNPSVEASVTRIANSALAAIKWHG